jgi:hypothetical protein
MKLGVLTRDHLVIARGIVRLKIEREQRRKF